MVEAPFSAPPQSAPTASLSDDALVASLHEEVAARARARLARAPDPDLPEDRYMEAVRALLDVQLSSLLPLYADARVVREMAGGAAPRQWVLTPAAVALVILGGTLVGSAEPVVLFGFLVVASAGVLGTAALERRRRRRRAASLAGFGGTVRAAEFDVALDALFEGAAERATSPEWGDPGTEVVALADGPELGRVAEAHQTIPTEARRRVEVALRRRFGSAVGLAGSRGAGKTELARSFTVGARWPVVGVFLAAPVKYDHHAFLMRVAKELCLAVLATGPYRRRWWLRSVRELATGLTPWAAAGGAAVAVGLGVAAVADVFAAEGVTARSVSTTAVATGFVVVLAGIVVVLARRLLAEVGVTLQARARALRRHVEFTETQTAGGEGSVSARGIGFKRTFGTSLVRTALTDVDLVREFDELVQAVSREGGQVRVAIDELDKMPSDEDAIEFLNHVKVLFAVRNCSFLVSVSDSAWARFEHRGLPFRDAFDSSLDEVVPVEVLTFRESRNLLRRRAPEVTDLQALLCHCLAGGVPRDLLRAARQLAQAGDRVPDRTFAAVVGRLLADDVAAKVAAGEHRLLAIGAPRRRPDAMRAVAAWRDHWPDAVRVTAHLVLALQTGAPGGTSGDAALDAAVDAACQDVLVYVAIAHTLREGFAPGGPAARLGADPLLLDGFAGVARARRRLGFEPASALDELDDARARLGLAPLR